MLFVFHGIDRDDGAGIRAATRDAHAAYHHARNNPVGGPLLGTDGQPCGTMYIFDASDRSEADTIVAADPYVQAGLFGTATTSEFIAIDWPT